MIKENTKVGITFLLLGLGLGIAALFLVIFTELAEEVMENEMRRFDGTIIGYFKAIDTPFLDSAMIFITEMGSVWFLTTLSTLTVVVLWVKYKDKWGILFFLVAVGIGGLLTKMLKGLYERGRPSINPEIDAVGYSFPSGHSMGSLIFYGFIMYLVIRGNGNALFKWVSIFLMAILVTLIGMSRVYLGAHFPSDVLAGFIAGAIWLILCLIALEWIQWQSKSSVRPVYAIRDMLVSILRAVKKRFPANK
ncbi:phosphatase PAP2 family protein [Planococcus shenhongbingii]|uniref:Phosphatase PAP2 family protein n=1 Tax=Planococcus shenhongbingii TaxID=3058398 RepID=A0ABT8NF19_9BACL|nr:MULTISPECIES: phosphatase PAP2 family protein [unclassified Planococcus (in: firmicutes)]MDN7246441.1 phosphatase PAP2 family protein [Planococcus sp. N017]WKA59433.1 phosphatase PAP2 family protein [Planococcus sp. N016]